MNTLNCDKSQPEIMELVSALIAQSGAIGGLIHAFEQMGLGSMIQSWTGTGQNQAVSSSQSSSVMGSENLTAIAAKFGSNPQDVQQKISTYLPKVIDLMTPKGEVRPDQFSLSNLISMGAKFLGS